MEKTLHAHYTQQLVQLSSPFLDDYHWELSSSVSEDGPAQFENPFRWVKTIESKTIVGEKVTCHFYSESFGAYWSFQWCPQQGVYQGNIGKQMAFEPKHVLGKYHPLSDENNNDLDEALETLDSFITVFVQDLKHHFGAPGTTIQLYDNGDTCGDAPSNKEFSARQRRITGVILHDARDSYAMEHCAKSWSTPIVESVDEHQVCQYVVHVCMPAATNDDGASEVSDNDEQQRSQEGNHPMPTMPESKVNQINETIQGIHKVLHAYLYRGESDRYTADRTTSLRIALPPLPRSRMEYNLQLIRDMFRHAYDGYMFKAFPSSELKPITCKPAGFNLVQIPALTLIDSLDMLVVLNNFTEFARSVERLRILHTRMAENNKFLDSKVGKGGLFALNQNVSVFETNIRVLGGLLSGHQLAEALLTSKVPEADVWSAEGRVLLGTTATRLSSAGTSTDGIPYPDRGSEDTQYPADLDIDRLCHASSSLIECERTSSGQHRDRSYSNETIVYWSYDGFLLELAHDIGRRLLPAFKTKTGIPYGTVNLLSGIPHGETTIASLAGGGTLSLEMELLSRLSGDPSFGKAAKLSARALWMRRSPKNLLGKHLCTHRGEWTESLSGIGSNSDSFYEYLIKHHVLFPEDEDFWLQLIAAYGGIHNESRVGEWYSDVDMTFGSHTGANRRVFEALMAFYPGMQVLLGELTPAARSLNSFFMVREFLGFLPERFNFGFWKVDGLGGKHHLRPELLESGYFMHRATKGMQVQARRLNNNRNSNHSSTPLGSSGWQWAADFALHALEEHTRTTCGYASIRELSPLTTGSIASSNSKGLNGKVRLLNEMPSFFLSETLKYLYLTFDEENILHTDQDREWIFTTEAHPIHYAPPAEQQSKRDARTEDTIEQVKALLRNRIKGDKSTLSSPWHFLSLEKWSEGTQLRNYVKRMEPVVQEVGDAHLAELRHRDAYDRRTHSDVQSTEGFFFDSSLLESFLSPDQVSVNDFFNDTPEGGNLAHLTFRKRGHRHRLKKACPNYYASDLLWIHALNGGANDYADIYQSTASDENGESNSLFRVFGALDALSIHGSGLHVLDFYDKSQKCLLYEKQTQASNAVPNRAIDNDLIKSGKDRFDLGGELGFFDVSAFSGGTGFYIQHVATGETMIATLIDEHIEEELSEAFVMVYSDGQPSKISESGKTTPSYSWSLSESRWTSLFKRRQRVPESRDAAASRRSVVMADMQGNAFVCHVEIVHSAATLEDGNSAKDDENRIEVVVAQFPCAPALFGPTHMSELAKTGGMVVEAFVRPPPEGDEYGCRKEPSNEEFIPTAIEDLSPAVNTASGSQVPGNSDSQQDIRDGTCRDSEVRLVRRGLCTFEEKAINQKNAFHAEAVIMINSEQEELFVMSGGGPDEAQSDVAYPVTVLVTGSDGEKILDLVATSAEDGFVTVTARVSLLRQEAVFQETGNAFTVSGNQYWPAVRASSEALQIFAKGGWGVFAVQRESKTVELSLEWQLYLMRHES
jgi:Glycosyl hydrolase family 47